MDNDVICGELKINEAFIRGIIKITLDEIGLNNSAIIVNNVDREGKNIKINNRQDNADIESKELDSYHDVIRSYVENHIKQSDINIVMGDENMCFKEFIIKIVDKLVELTNSYRSEIYQTKDNNKKLNNEIDSYKNRITNLEYEFNIIRTELNKVLEEKISLEKSLLILSNEKRALEKELNNRCREVKLIFDSIHNIDSKYIDELEPYIRLHRLEPFIVSSTLNIDALNKIWRVAKLAIKNNDLDTSAIMQNYFKYMVELFNDAKNETVVTIDSVNEGDNYNVHDFECIDCDKSYGGIISKVYLPGFINNYNNKRVEKSLVDLKEK